MTDTATQQAPPATKQDGQTDPDPLVFKWGGRSWRTRILTVGEWRQYLSMVAELKQADLLADELRILRRMYVHLLGEEQAEAAESWPFSEGLALLGLAVAHSRAAEAWRPRRQDGVGATGQRKG